MSLKETSLDKLDFAWNKGMHIRPLERWMKSKYCVITQVLLPHSRNNSVKMSEEFFAQQYPPYWKWGKRGAKEKVRKAILWILIHALFDNFLKEETRP